MPDHIRVGWTMVCEQSTMAYTPLPPYRITVCPSWTEERSQSPVDMEHMPLLHQRAHPIQVSRQPTLLPWSCVAPCRCSTRGRHDQGRKFRKKWVSGPQWLLHRWWYPLCRHSTLPPVAAPPPSMAWAAATLLPQPAAIRQMLKVSLLLSCCCTGPPVVILWGKITALHTSRKLNDLP